MFNVIEHIFKFFGHLCNFFKYLLKSFAYFLIGLFLFLLLSFKSLRGFFFLYILDSSPLLDVCFENIFYHSIACPLILLMRYL